MRIAAFSRPAASPARKVPLAPVGIAIAIWLLTAAVGCARVQPPAGPAIQITSPQDGAAIAAGATTIEVLVSDFALADKLGQANFPGQGHIHYFLDVPAPTVQGQPAFPPAGSTWADTADASCMFNNILVGSHTITVELVNNDHTPLNPPATKTVTVTASPGGIP